MNLSAFLVLCVTLWWSVIGAVILACLQDSYRASDDRDPMIVDLPLWQILVCGPVAWALRFFTERRVQTIQENVNELLTINAWQLAVCCLIGLAFAVMFYLGFTFQLAGGWK